MQIIGAGKSIYFRAPGYPKPHLYFVLTDPDGNPGRVVWVMVRTRQPYTDSTVVLNKSDHPFIQNETSVDYGYATFRPVNKILTAIGNGTCKLHRDMDNNLLDRVRDGLLASPRTPNAIKDYCKRIF